MKKIICFLLTLVSMLAFSPIGISQTNGNTQIVKISKQEFLSKVFDYTAPNASYKGDIPAVVDFYADWCRPCKMMDPHLKALAEEYGGKIIIYKVDLMVEKEIAEDLEIKSIPTLYFFPVKGDPTVVLGYQEKEVLKSIIEQELKP